MRTLTAVLAALALCVVSCHDADEPGSDEAMTAAGSGAAGHAGGAAGAAAGSGAAGTPAAGRSGSSAPTAGRGGGGQPAAGSDGAAADGGADPGDSGGDEPTRPAAGSFVALTYNVAGLPEGLSSSMPSRNTPIIGPKLNDYELVFLQESWQTPEVNPLAPLRAYHEILVAASTHPYKTEPAAQPFGNNPSRPSALLGDGLNIFSRFPLGETERVAWRTCVESASDCLAFKGFSLTPAQIEGRTVHLYDLHMEAGESAADDMARDADIDEMLAFMKEHSSDVAVIVAGDFNLETDSEPAASQLTRLLASGGLTDACRKLDCPLPGNIDKVLYRSSADLALEAESWKLESAMFLTPEGGPLSDHEPVAVRFHWQAPE